LINKIQHSSVNDIDILEGLTVIQLPGGAEVRERLSESKRLEKEVDMQRFNFKKLTMWKLTV
jgi:hypothetical protein